MSTPLSYKLSLFSKPLLSGEDFPLCLIGDSKITDASTEANLGFGIQRTWNVPAWSGRSIRTHGGPPAWGGAVFFTATGGSIFSRNPAAAFGSGISGINPNIAAEKVYSAANRTDGNDEWKASIRDLNNYASGNWTASNYVKARIVYYANSTGTSMRLVGRRERSEGSDLYNSDVDTATVIDFANNSGLSLPGPMQYAEASCGNGSGNPSVSLRTAAGIDESSKNFNIIGVRFYRTDAGGIYQPGFSIMDVAFGGGTTLTALSNIGGGSSPNTDAAAAIKWFDLMGAPKYWLVEVGQNLTVTESTELAAGTKTEYKTNVSNIISRINTICAGYTSPTTPIILLVSPYKTGYSSTVSETRSTALYELAQENSNVCFIDGYQLMGNPGYSAFRLRMVPSSPNTNFMPPTGGTFTITYKANTTSGISWAATPATVRSNLEGLASIGNGNVSVLPYAGGYASGGGGNGSTIYFGDLLIIMQGTLASDTTIPTVSGASLTGAVGCSLGISAWNAWSDADGIHPSPHGAVLWAGKLWSIITGNYSGASAGSPMKGILS